MIGSFLGQLATSRSATSAISPESRCIFSPWKAGSISLRWLRWARSSSRITEFDPTTGSSSLAPSPGCSTSGGAVKISRRCSGSEWCTNGGAWRSRIVKRFP